MSTTAPCGAPFCHGRAGGLSQSTWPDGPWYGLRPFTPSRAHAPLSRTWASHGMVCVAAASHVRWARPCWAMVWCTVAEAGHGRHGGEGRLREGTFAPTVHGRPRRLRRPRAQGPAPRSLTSGSNLGRLREGTFQQIVDLLVKLRRSPGPLGRPGPSRGRLPAACAPEARDGRPRPNLGRL